MIKRSYYTAILFEEDPNLHMTLQYRKDLNPLGLADFIHDVEELLFIDKVQPTRFTAQFGDQQQFGWKEKVNALAPLDIGELPAALQRFVKANWRPHITTDHKELTLTGDRLAILHKKVVVVSWRLREYGKSM